MDQNSTNDTEKRNWRERLGIGGKEMPRISGEFSKTHEAPVLEVKQPVKPAQTVAKPAPMAPRLPMKAVAQGATPQPQSPSPGATPQAPDAFAEKLRSQRAAAEKLAEQRVAAAKLRADSANSSAPPDAVAATASTVPDPAPASATVTAAPAAKPKFSFADEDGKAEPNRDLRALPPARSPQRPAPQQPQLSPPRPPLGGQPRLPSGATAGFKPQYRPQPPQGYRPISSSTAYVPPPLPQSTRGINGPLSHSAAGEPRLHSARATPETFRRAPQDSLGYAGAGYESSQRSVQRPTALRAPAQPYDDDYSDEIFEDAPQPRSSRRASATDYNQAYRENEGAYGNERRRSGGPWLLLLFLMLAAGAAGAGVWYYQTKVKSVASNVKTESVPVVPAPVQSAKTAPELPVDGQPSATVPSTSKKQIYDRIIGDNEILGGQVVPTEETPIQPETEQGDSGQLPQPAGSINSLSEGGEALPLPMPPPPGSSSDSQGVLTSPPAGKSVALTVPPASTNSTGLAVETEIAPVPGESATAAVAPEQATPPAAAAPAKEEIVNLDPAPIQKKPIVKKSTAAVNNTVALGSEPVVLVPPSDAVDASAPLVVDQPVASQQAPAVKKKKTLFDLLRGNNEVAPEAQTAATTPVVPEQQVVASLPEPAPIQQPSAPAQVAVAGSGYFVQLASFKSQAEASTEFGRLKTKHAGILGNLPSAINPATVGGSTRFRLAVGPLSSREQATRICSSLVAAGERDCLVRKQ